MQSNFQNPNGQTQNIQNPPAEKAMQISKCASCGANMGFSPALQMLFCTHCTSKSQISNLAPAFNLPLSALNDKSEWSDETHTYICSNCGAAEVLNKSEIATHCAFCGTPNIVEKEGLSGLKPNAVSPFKIELENAGAIAKKWYNKRLFAPTAFKKCTNPKEIKGVYYPVFVFNADTLSHFRGVLVRIITTTRRINGRTVTTTREQRIPISGTHPRSFADLLVQACNGLDKKTLKKISPFSLSRLNAYSPDYLFGFVANQHKKDGFAAWGEATKTMENAIRNGILSGYTYNRIESLDIQTQMQNQSFKYALLPVYVGHCTYKNKLYNFYLNGENGKLDAKAPKSAVKILLTIFFPIGLLVLLTKGIIGLFKKIFRKRR